MTRSSSSRHLSRAFGAPEFPGLDEEGPRGLFDAGDDLIAAAESSRAEVEALTPPAELAADHELVLEHFAAVLDLLERAIAAAETGDAAAVRSKLERTGTSCKTGPQLSPAIAASTDVHFEPNARFCETR